MWKFNCVCVTVGLSLPCEHIRSLWWLKYSATRKKNKICHVLYPNSKYPRRRKNRSHRLYVSVQKPAVEREWDTGRQCTVPFSVQKWIISRRRCAMLLNISSEKSKMTRELALVELSLACLMVTWKFYDGSSKRITILSILVRSDKLLSTIFSVSLHMCTNNCICLIFKIWHLQFSSFFSYLCIPVFGPQRSQDVERCTSTAAWLSGGEWPIRVQSV